MKQILSNMKMKEFSIVNDNVILQFNNGDERAANLIFQHFYTVLRHYASKLSGCQEEAEDISLRAFQKLFERRKNFETVTQIKAFLYTAVRNSCLNYLRSKKQYQKFQQSDYARKLNAVSLSHNDDEIKEELVEVLRVAIEQLPRECRKIFNLLYYEHLKPKEVAVTLSISIHTVYNQKRIAINTLRMAFASEGVFVNS